MSIKKYLNCYDHYTKLFEKLAEPLFALALRYYVFCDMFMSGWLKVKDITNGEWNRVVFIFEHEFKVPLLSPEIAAAGSIFNEVIVASMLLVGLFTRLSAAALLFMAIVIELTYISHLQHYLWIVMLTYLVIRGGGFFSLDNLIRKKLF